MRDRTAKIFPVVQLEFILKSVKRVAFRHAKSMLFLLAWSYSNWFSPDFGLLACCFDETDRQTARWWWVPGARPFPSLFRHNFTQDKLDRYLTRRKVRSNVVFVWSARPSPGGGSVSGISRSVPLPTLAHQTSHPQRRVPAGRHSPAVKN